jgi:hypothetical protein
LDAISIGVLLPLYLMQDAPELAEGMIRSDIEIRCGNAVFRGEAGTALALYRGDTDRAKRVWEPLEPLVVRDGLYSAPAFRVFGVRSEVCALLAGTPGDRERARAKKLSRKLKGRSYPQAVAVYHSVRANLAGSRGKHDEAARHLATAIEAFEAAEHLVDAATCRYVHARITGSPTEPAATQLQTYGVRVPQRWAACWFPTLVS